MEIIRDVDRFRLMEAISIISQHQNTFRNDSTQYRINLSIHQNSDVHVNSIMTTDGDIIYRPNA